MHGLSSCSSERFRDATLYLQKTVCASSAAEPAFACPPWRASCHRLLLNTPSCHAEVERRWKSPGQSDEGG